MENKDYFIREIFTSYSVARAMRRVRKYFRILHASSIRLKPELRRKSSHLDYSYFAMTATRKVISLFPTKSAYIGSSSVSNKPWASLNSNIQAEYKFYNFDSVIDHYESKLETSRGSLELRIHFKNGNNILKEISKDYNLASDMTIGLCFLLTNDLIFHAGPDNKFFYDLFTNNLMESFGDIDIEDWERMRCKAFGKQGITNKISSATESEYDEDDEYSDWLKWHNDMRSNYTSRIFLPKKNKGVCSVSFSEIKNEGFFSGIETIPFDIT